MSIIFYTIHLDYQSITTSSGRVRHVLTNIHEPKHTVNIKYMKIIPNQETMAV